MAAPSKYVPRIHDDWAWSLAVEGKTDQQIADAMHINVRTLRRWKYVADEKGNPILDADGNKQPTSFGKSLEEAKEVADSHIEKSLYQLASGYEYEEREEIIAAGSDGKPKPIKVRKFKKYVPPNVMAIMYWLNNRTKNNGKWTQKQVVALEPSVDLQQQIKGIADLINNPTENRKLPE